jgi:arylsulfatase A-like enzyme
MDRLRRYPAADVMVDQARSWLSSLGERQPFFLWLHLMDPHHPYYPPLEALSTIGESQMTARRARFLNSLWIRDLSSERLQRYRAEILSLYDAGISWVDKQISRLVHALQLFQRWDETALVVTADHGEEFLEHGGRYHSLTGLNEELIHVPLLLRVPQTSAARLSQGPFSLMHLAPTLLDALGVAVPAGFQGRSHWPQISTGNLRGEPVVTECIEVCNNPFRASDRMGSRLLAVKDSNYKLVIHFTDKTECLYDLKKDPEEKSPLPMDALTKERARLLQVARAHIHESRLGRNADLRLRARLRDLQQSLDLRSREASASPVSR